MANSNLSKKCCDVNFGLLCHYCYHTIWGWQEQWEKKVQFFLLRRVQPISTSWMLLGGGSLLLYLSVQDVPAGAQQKREQREVAGQWHALFTEWPEQTRRNRAERERVMNTDMKSGEHQLPKRPLGWRDETKSSSQELDEEAEGRLHIWVLYIEMQLKGGELEVGVRIVSPHIVAGLLLMHYWFLPLKRFPRILSPLPSFQVCQLAWTLDLGPVFRVEARIRAGFIIGECWIHAESHSQNSIFYYLLSPASREKCWQNFLSWSSATCSLSPCWNKAVIVL